MRERLEIEVESLRERDRSLGRVRSWAALVSEALGCDGRDGRPDPCPELPPDLVQVEVGHRDLGCDQQGRALHTDMESWWRREWVADEGQQAAYCQLWRAIEAETGRYLWEKHRPPQELQ